MVPILALNMGVLNEHSTPRKDFDCRSTEKQMLHDGKLGQLGPNRMTDQNISKAFYIDSILRSSSSASSKSEHSEIKDDIQVSDTSISSSVSKTFQETRSERGSPSSTSSAHSSTGGTGGYVRPTPVSLRPALLYATQPSAPTSSCGSQNHHHHHLSASSLDIFGLGSSYSSGSTPLYSSHISACLDSTPHPYAVSLNNNLSTGFHVGPLTNNSSPLYNSSSSSWLQGKPQLFSFQASKPNGRRTRKPGIDRKPRQAYSSKQLERLEAEFKVDKYLSVSKRMELSQALTLTEVQIKTWFQNRRTKWKKQMTARMKMAQRQGLWGPSFYPGGQSTTAPSTVYQPFLSPCYHHHHHHHHSLVALHHTSTNGGVSMTQSNVALENSPLSSSKQSEIGRRNT